MGWLPIKVMFFSVKSLPVCSCTERFTEPTSVTIAPFLR